MKDNKRVKITEAPGRNRKGGINGIDKQRRCNGSNPSP